MLIALDFDDTYTKDPYLWFSFVSNALIQGHLVYIVTARSDDGDNLDIELSQIVHLYNIPIIYCSHSPKRWYCRTTHNLEFDVWIDDSPESIISRTDEVGYDCL